MCVEERDDPPAGVNGGRLVVHGLGETAGDPCPHRHFRWHVVIEEGVAGAVVHLDVVVDAVDGEGTFEPSRCVADGAVPGAEAAYDGAAPLRRRRLDHQARVAGTREVAPRQRRQSDQRRHRVDALTGDFRPCRDRAGGQPPGRWRVALPRREDV